MRRWRPACLADTDADAREQKLAERLRDAAQHCHATPDDGRHCNEVAPAVAHRPDRGRNAQRRVERREGEARQKAELDVGQPELAPHRLEHNARELPVELIERRHRSQNEQAIGATGRSNGRRHEERREG